MAQEQRRTGDQPERRSRASGRSRTTQNRGGRKKGRAATSFALLYVVFVIGISALLACIGWVAANDVLALNKEQKTVTVTISSEDSFGDVADMLKENGLIEYKSLFNLFATFTGSKDEVVPGTFTLNTNMDYRALLTGMSANSSSKATISVTIPEGYTIDQIFSLLEERNVASVEDLQDMAANHDYAFSFLQDIELGDYHRLEGYLFPDTYEFTTPENPLYVINKMLVQFDAKVTDEMRQEILNSGRSIHEVLTVASMIEKETDGSDRETIQPQRLRRHQRLSADRRHPGLYQRRKCAHRCGPVHRLPLQHLPLSRPAPRTHCQPRHGVHPGGHEPRRHVLLLLCPGGRQHPPLLWKWAPECSGARFWEVFP